MAFFRRTTMGNVVVMGRKTRDSIGSPLKGRQNIVLSRRAALFESTEHCNFVPNVAEALAGIESLAGERAFIIGGAYTYEEFCGLVDDYIVTFVDHVAEDADAFLPKSMRDEFLSWPRENLGTYPAVPGQDQFPFHIARFTAPDAEVRQLLRLDFAQSAAEKIARRKNMLANRRATGNPASILFSR